jgi:hypothetical protein
VFKSPHAHQTNQGVGKSGNPLPLEGRDRMFEPCHPDHLLFKTQTGSAEDKTDF